MEPVTSNLNTHVSNANYADLAARLAKIATPRNSQFTSPLKPPSSKYAASTRNHSRDGSPRRINDANRFGVSRDSSPNNAPRHSSRIVSRSLCSSPLHKDLSASHFTEHGLACPRSARSSPYNRGNKNDPAHFREQGFGRRLDMDLADCHDLHPIVRQPDSQPLLGSSQDCPPFTARHSLVLNRSREGTPRKANGEPHDSHHSHPFSTESDLQTSLSQHVHNAFVNRSRDGTPRLAKGDSNTSYHSHPFSSGHHLVAPQQHPIPGQSKSPKHGSYWGVLSSGYPLSNWRKTMMLIVQLCFVCGLVITLMLRPTFTHIISHDPQYTHGTQR